MSIPQERTSLWSPNQSRGLKPRRWSIGMMLSALTLGVTLVFGAAPTVAMAEVEEGAVVELVEKGTATDEATETDTDPADGVDIATDDALSEMTEVLAAQGPYQITNVPINGSSTLWIPNDPDIEKCIAAYRFTIPHRMSVQLQCTFNTNGPFGGFLVKLHGLDNGNSWEDETINGYSYSSTYSDHTKNFWVTLDPGQYQFLVGYAQGSSSAGSAKFTVGLHDNAYVNTSTYKSMIRVYNPNSGEHFYTSSAPESVSLLRAGWQYEGVMWKAPNSSRTPVYRLYSGTDHHYTTSAAERDQLRRAGWKYEGVGWYSDDAKGVPLYRQFNPNVNPWSYRNNSGSHNYTTSLSEHNGLVRAGWHGEGIAWYGMRV